MRRASSRPEMPYRWPWWRRFSATVSRRSRLGDWKATPSARRTASGSVARSWPAIETVPACSGSRVASRRNSVVLPLPFGPRNPKMAPARHREPHAVEGAAVAVVEGDALGGDGGRRHGRRIDVRRYAQERMLREW